MTNNNENIITLSDATNALIGKVEACITDVNAAIAEDKYSEIGKQKIILNNALSDLNKSVTKDVFEHFLAMENPLYEAIKAGYHSVYAVKTERNRLTGTEKLSLTTRDNNVIDIVALEDYSPKKLFANGQWIHCVEAFKYALWRKACASVMTEVEQARFIEKFIPANARECDAQGDPTSMASLVKAMQKMFDAILFMPSEKKPELNAWKVDKRDVSYLTLCAFGPGKGKRSIALPEDGTIVKYLTVAMNRSITGGSYTLEMK